MQSPVSAHIFQVLPELSYSTPNLSPVDLKLGFTWSAKTDAASAAPPRAATRLTREVRPCPSQSRQPILILRQFNLELTFPSASSGGEKPLRRPPARPQSRRRSQDRTRRM